MTRRTKIVAAVAAASLLALTLAWAQPGGGGSRGGGYMSTDQVLGFLALNPEVDLTDEQLLKLRSALRDSYTEQMEMRDAMRNGDVDFQEIRAIMSEMRQSMMSAVGGVLTDAQSEVLKGAMARTGGRRGGGGGGGGGFRQ